MLPCRLSKIFNKLQGLFCFSRYYFTVQKSFSQFPPLSLDFEGFFFFGSFTYLAYFLSLGFFAALPLPAFFSLLLLTFFSYFLPLFPNYQSESLSSASELDYIYEMIMIMALYMIIRNSSEVDGRLITNIIVQTQLLMNTQDVHTSQIRHQFKIKGHTNSKQMTKERKLKPRIRQVLNKLDKEQNQEDQGIEDYRIGGYHPVHIGEILANRYVVMEKLGWGHFATVWLCKDFKHHTHVAVKIQKSSPNYTQAAFDEVEVLQKVSTMCSSSEWAGKTRDDAHVVGLLNAFIFKSPYGHHFCMVFEILRCNLLDVMKSYNFEGLPLPVCQQIGRQVLAGLDYLHRVCGIIHTDLKPENVMIGFTKEELEQVISTSQLDSRQLHLSRMGIFREFLGYEALDENQNIEMNVISNSTLVQLKKQLNTGTLTENRQNISEQEIKADERKINKMQAGPTHHCEEKAKLSNFFSAKSVGIARYQRSKLKMPFHVKIAYLGNASWKHHHFSALIQTRQYRSPEVILGHYYNETADIWSFACIMYELLTGDLLFQPKKNKQGSINADHLAKMQKLTGPFIHNFIVRNPKAKRKYFKEHQKIVCQQASLRSPLQKLLQIKNRIKQKEARSFAEFLSPMLVPEPEKRIGAQEGLELPWLKIKKFSSPCRMNDDQYDELRQRLNAEKEIVERRQKITKQDIAQSSLVQKLKKDNDKIYRIADIRYVDRSFTNLGYIGHSDGINFDELDTTSCQFS